MRMDLCPACDSGNLSFEEGFNEREHLGIKVRVYEKWTRCGNCKVCTAYKSHQLHHNEMKLRDAVIDVLIRQREAVRGSLKDWATKKGHDACWYFPELFQRLAIQLQVEVPLALPTISPDAFREGCMRFQRELYK